jgi:hypothetical protein
MITINGAKAGDVTGRNSLPADAAPIVNFSLRNYA